MKFSVAALVSLLVSAGANAQFMINTPTNAVQCQPLLLTWQGGVAPYFLSILPGGQPSAAALEDLGQQSGTQVTWLVNIAAGTSLGLTLRDSTGAVANSAPFPVLNSTDASCVGKPASTGGSAPGSTSSGATTPPATTPPATTAPGSTTPSTSSSSSSSATNTVPSTTHSTSSSSSSSPTATTNAASALLAQAGVAGVLGAVVAALAA